MPINFVSPTAADLAKMRNPRDLGSIVIELSALKSLQQIADDDSMEEGPYGLVNDLLQRHACGEYGDLDEEEAHEVKGLVRSWYGGVYGAEIEIVTDTKANITRVTRG